MSSFFYYDHSIGPVALSQILLSPSITISTSSHKDVPTQSNQYFSPISYQDTAQ